jgi:hypothetical protein
MTRFVIKKPQVAKAKRLEAYKPIAEKNNEEKQQEDMNTEEKIIIAKGIIDGEEKRPVKRINRKGKDIIERTESSKIILTEDNKQLLID